MTSRMVEIGARILEPQAWAALRAGDTLAYQSRRTSSLRKARKFIEAMREPTPEMLEIVEPCPAHWDLNSPGGPQMHAAITVDRMVTAGKWRSLIDAALREEAGRG